MKDKVIVAEKTQRLIEMTAGFCDEYLDEDYKQLCEKLIRKMSRKRIVPFLYGRIEIWAAAIIYALGQINFLFDRSFEPYVSADDICNYFGTSKSTTSQKAKVIRDMFKLGYWDKEFSTSHVMQSSPFSNLVMVNGLIVDKRSLPPEIQELIRRKENSKKGEDAAIVEKYKMYREIGRELNHKIMDTCLDRDVLMKSARLLGIARGDNTFVFDSEDETSVLMDFALNEYRVNNKNTIEIYREKIGWENEVEKNILDSKLSSYTSLFKIISISEAENTLILNDLLNKKDNIRLIDIGFSKTATPGLLLFIRLVPFKDFNTTSGISFVFPGDLERYLLRRYRKLRRKVKSGSDSIKRFVSFYKLNKTDGMEVRYE